MTCLTWKGGCGVCIHPCGGGGLVRIERVPRQGRRRSEAGTTVLGQGSWVSQGGEGKRHESLVPSSFVHLVTPAFSLEVVAVGEETPGNPSLNPSPDWSAPLSTLKVRRGPLDRWVSSLLAPRPPSPTMAPARSSRS